MSHLTVVKKNAPFKEGRATVPTRRQFNAALQRCDGYPHAVRNKAMLVTFFSLGLRPKELISLTLGDVYNFNSDSLHDDLVLLKTYTKRAKTRTLPLGNELLKEHLLSYIRSERRDKRNRFNSGGALFLSQRGGPFTANSVGNLMNEILEKRCNIARASAYSGRRFFATTLSRQGVDIRTIQVLMGHENIATTQNYLDADPLIIADAAKGVL